MFETLRLYRQKILDDSLVFMKKSVIPSVIFMRLFDIDLLIYINGVLVSGKSLDSKLPSFGLIWVASPPNTLF